MKKGYKILLSCGGLVLLLVLIFSNSYNYARAKKLEELADSLFQSKPEQSYETSSDTSESEDNNEEVQQLNEQVAELKKQLEDYQSEYVSQEDEIRDIAEKFIQAYYTRDSDRSNDDAMATYEGLVTASGLSSMESKLSQAPAEEGVRVLKDLIAQKTFVNSKSDSKASILCLAHIMDSFKYTNGLASDNSNTTTYLIQLELVYENNSWFVDSIAFEQSLYAVTNLPLDTIFS